MLERNNKQDRRRAWTYLQIMRAVEHKCFKCKHYSKGETYMEFDDMDERDMIHALQALEVLKRLETCEPCKSFSKHGCKYGFAPLYGYCVKFKPKQ